MTVVIIMTIEWFRKKIWKKECHTVAKALKIFVKLRVTSFAIVKEQVRHLVDVLCST